MVACSDNCRVRNGQRVIGVARGSVFLDLYRPRVLEPFLFAGVGFVVLLVVGSVWAHSAAVKHSIRGEYGLFAITGLMGEGKSYLMAYLADAARRGGRPVFANFELEGANLLIQWRDVYRAPDGALVLLDEFHEWWSSRDWDAPAEAMAWFGQLRKRGISCYYATQDLDDVARFVRRRTLGEWSAARFRSGHKYTLFQGRWVGSRAVKRKSASTVVLKRRRRVEASYDTRGLVRSAREWGDGAKAAVVQGSLPVGRHEADPVGGRSA